MDICTRSISTTSKFRKTQLLRNIVILGIFTLALFSSMNFYDAINVPFFGIYEYRGNLLLLFVSLFLVLSDTTINVFKRYKKLTLILACYFLSVLSVGVFTYFRYPLQNPLTLMNYVSSYLSIFWLIPLLYVAETGTKVENILKFVCAIGFIWIFLIFLQSMFYSFSGKPLFPFISVGSIRNDRIRVSTRCLGQFVLIYSFTKLFSKKTKISFVVSFFVFAMTLFTILFVQQTRSLEIVVLISLGLLYVVEKKTLFRKDVKLLLLCFVLVFLVVGGVFENFTDYITKYDLSVSARLYALKHYFAIFVNNPLFGMGFLAENSQYFEILRGMEGLAYTDDVGVIGQLAYLGIFIIPIVVMPVLRVLSILKHTHKTSDRWDLMLGMALLLFGTFFTLIIFDVQRIMYLPILLFVFEYEDKQNSNGAIKKTE